MKLALKETVKDLADARVRRAQMCAKTKELQAQLAATELGQELASAHDDLASMSGRIVELDELVRTGALVMFRVTGNKKVLPGIGIRETTLLTYQTSDAVVWCMTAYPNALRLDKRIFEKAARGMDLPFVEKGTNLTATIAKDLSSYLQDDEGKGGEE